RDKLVTGVQTCALPISQQHRFRHHALLSATDRDRAGAGSSPSGWKPIHDINKLAKASRAPAVIGYDQPGQRQEFRLVLFLLENRSEERRVGKEWSSRWG